MSETRKLSWKEIFLYSTGNFGISVVNSTILGFVLFFYLTEGFASLSQSPLVVGAIVGTALMVGRIVDAFVNPVVGWLSDNTRWKIGRRRPFVIVGLIPMIISFILLFNPPLFLLSTLNTELAELILVLYLFVIVAVFDGLFTFVFVPVYALMPEIAPTSEERIKLSMWGNIFAMLANVIGFVIAPILFMNIGFSSTSVFLGILVFICLLAILGIKESPGGSFKEQERFSLFQSLKISAKNRSYQIFIINQICMQFSFRILSAVMPFFTVSVLNLGLGDTLVLTLPYIIFALLSFPLWSYIANRIGMKKAFIYSMAVFTFPLFLNWLFLFTDQIFLIAIVMISLVGIGTGGLWIFPPAIIGDIVDQEEEELGIRRESMYYAFQEFTEKLAISFAILLEGIILGWFVVDIVAHPDYVLKGIYVPYYIYDPLGPILLLGLVAFLPMLVALVVFFRFPDMSTKE
ncbi:MAG: MFS transporter [Candidatus Hodarchaeales archaeon]|jgi:GPH family glycoside/pentoside/hexuronide:cation symporter